GSRQIPASQRAAAWTCAVARTANRTKMFHVKQFCPISQGNQLKAGAGLAASPDALERMILIEPGLAQGFFARAQIKAQLDGIGASHRQIELGAPVARDIVGNRLGENIRKGSARGPEHGPWLDAEGQRFEGRALELDHE